MSRPVDLTLTYVSEDSTVSRPTDIAIQPKVLGFGPRGPKGDAGDKHYEQIFNLVDSITVTHNLSKYPAVTIVDSANDEIIADINHVSSNQLTIFFGATFSGRVICN